MEKKKTQEMILKGIGGSPGICIGKAYLVDKEGVDVIKKYVIREESPDFYLDVTVVIGHDYEKLNQE